MNIIVGNHFRIMILMCTNIVIPVLSIYQTTFCMVTSRRPNGVTYVDRVVETYEKQNIFRMDGVGLYIIDTDGSSNGKDGIVRLTDRILAKCDTQAQDREGIPSCQVRQRTLDITSALGKCAAVTSGWVILVEDDCEICPNSLDEALVALSELHTSEISMAKLSKNMCATAFPVSRVQAYVDATLQRLYTHPHDIILAEEWAPPPVHVYKHFRNLFHHIGSVSTEVHKNSELWQEKYSLLREDTCGEELTP